MTTAHIRREAWRLPSPFLHIVALLLGLTFTARAVAFTPLGAADVDAIVPQLERYIEHSMAEWRTPGLAIGIIADDRLVYAKGFGVRTHGVDEPVTPATIFQLGSATKAMLGVTQAILVDEGKLGWNDKVIDHFPAFRMKDPWVTREFEIRDLLAQRSGLPGYALTALALYGYPREDMIAALRFVDPVSSFRSEFAYQNIFHMVAGEIVARRGNTENWETFLQTRLLDPLGMTSSSYSADKMAGANNAASGHRHDFDDIVIDPLAPFPYNAGGAGNLNTSVEDASRWLRLQINQGDIDGNRLVSKEALAATHQPLIPITGWMKETLALSDDDQLSYATGWVVHTMPEGRVIEHGGGTSGFTSHMLFDPDRRVGVAILTNLSIGVGNGMAVSLGQYAISLLQGRKPDNYASQALDALRRDHAAQQASMTPPDNALPARAPEAYTGTYHSPVMGTVVLRDGGDGTLAFVLGPGEMTVTLTPWSGDVFVTRATLPAFGPNALIEKRKLQFIADTEGGIQGFEWTDDDDASGQPPFRRVIKNKPAR